MHIRRPHDLGAVVREARRSRHLSQEALAQQLGVSRLWVNEFELGKRSARIDIVLLALNVLGVSLLATIDEAEAAHRPDCPTTPTAKEDEDIIDVIASTGAAKRTKRTRP